MEPKDSSSSRDVALPALGLAALRRALRREAGPLAAIHALHAAGYDAGEAVYRAFAKAAGEDPAILAERTFWSRLSAFMARRGWGTLTHVATHPGIGLLETPDWAEVDEPGAERQPVCAFSAGLLSGLLTHAAGDPVAVLEVRCRGQGDSGCSFAFGSAAAVHDLYGLMIDGRNLEEALSEL